MANGHCVSCENGGLLVRQRRFEFHLSPKGLGSKVEALHPNHVWQSDMRPRSGRDPV